MDTSTLTDSSCTSMAESGVNLISPSINEDELMTALDALEGHADDTIQASRNTELHWIQTLNERDELILENRRTISDLQQLNHRLNEENKLLRQQLLQEGHTYILNALQDDAGESRKLSLQLQGELEELQMDVVTRLKDQNVALQERLIKCGQSYTDVFNRLRQERMRINPEIINICEDLINSKRHARNKEEQSKYKQQVEELCELYDTVIKGACEECEEYLLSIERLEKDNGQISVSQDSVSPRKSRPGSSMATDQYYMELLFSSEQANRKLREQVEALEKEMNSREQKSFNETMARIESTNREQMEKMKGQISELSKELSLLNVDNRALREKILRTENDNEGLEKQVKNSAAVGEELHALQSNLDSQLSLNHSLELKVRDLELIRMEHTTLCENIKRDYIEASDKLLTYEQEIKDLQRKLENSRDLQVKFDQMNSHLNDSMLRIQTENSHLLEEVSIAKREVGVAHMIGVQEAERQTEQNEAIMRMKEIEAAHVHEMNELATKLENTEKQRQNANAKVKALRERLKTMQESWQKISTDTESSFTALRDQYQQQIKEYKSIIDSLKSQNSSLGSRIESMKKVSAQNDSSQVSNLEQQISEYKGIMEGYREENILLRKELSLVIASLQRGESDTTDVQENKSKAKADEFAKLRDILNTAKSECENLQLHKAPPRSRTSTVERDSSYSEQINLSKYSATIQESTENLGSSINASSRVGKGADVIEKPWRKYRAAQMNNVKRLEPLAVSTPRTTKYDMSSLYQPPVLDTRPLEPQISQHNEPGEWRKPVAPKCDYTASSSTDQQRTRSNYDTPGNLRYETTAAIKSSNIEKPSALQHNSYLLTSSQHSKSTSKYSAPTLSKTKEVVEIKQRNSVELDPSKAFKPINPDNGKPVADKSTDLTKYSTSSSYKPSTYTAVNSKTSQLISTSKPSYTSHSSSYYSRPYKSSYEPLSYRPKHYSQGESKLADDYKNLSADSAYGSPSRSFSKPPSTSSYTSAYHRDYSIPSLTSHSRYSSAARNESKHGDSISKQLEYEKKQNKLLNQTLDDLEVSMDSYSSTTQADKHMLERMRERSTGSRYAPLASANYATVPFSTRLIPSTNVSSSNQCNIVSSVNSHIGITTPRAFTFHGSVVYDSIY